MCILMHTHSLPLTLILHTHSHIRIQTYTHTHMHIHSYIHVHINLQPQIHPHAHTLACTRVHIHTLVRVHTHIFYLYTKSPNTHTHTFTHHLYTYVVQSLICVRLFATPRTACSMPGFPVFHHLLEHAQTRVYIPSKKTGNVKTFVYISSSARCQVQGKAKTKKQIKHLKKEDEQF